MRLEIYVKLCFPIPTYHQQKGEPKPSQEKIKELQKSLKGGHSLLTSCGLWCKEETNLVTPLSLSYGIEAANKPECRTGAKMPSEEPRLGRNYDIYTGKERQ